MDIFDSIIIGAGPAGLSAAFQLRRDDKQILLLEKYRVGGLLRNANLVENYPGFPQGVKGQELVALFKSQLLNLDIDIQHEEVFNIEYIGSLFYVYTKSGNTYKSKTLIVASGTKPNTFPQRRIHPRAEDKVVYQVAELDGVTGKRIVIVGAGDAAFDYAINLAIRDNHVIILNRGEEIKSLPLLVKRSKDYPQIHYRENTELIDVKLEGEELWIQVKSPFGEIPIQADYLLGAIGRTTNIEFLSKDLLKRENQLKLEGVFHIVGDVKNGIYRQTGIAVGDGLKAAMQIVKILSEDREV